MSYLRQLENASLLTSEKIGRDRIYKNIRLINILESNVLDKKLYKHMDKLQYDNEDRNEK